MSRQKQDIARGLGYCRVSTEDQTKGESLEIQRSRIETICAAERLALAAIYVEEGISGSRPFSARPEGAKLLQTAKRGDVIVALRLDRMFRNTSDALDTAAALNAHGVKLYLADMRGYIAGDAAGELHFSMLASFATFERKRIAERIRDSKRSLTARGVYGGGDAPFGYRKVPSASGETTRHGAPVHYLEPIPEIIATARALLAKGYSSRLAASHFAQLGHRVTHHAVNALFNRLRSQSA
ncbi:MAG: recombinase family protein [Hyphomicrobium sp.]|uniref:recombinase family protein n=1 Tax=Hyphomicrobium sp. TaxID=82 RepID=UPI0025BB69A4|nr:recombinase family protein [Hyphomicrobium sp.]MBZ0209266.1 recombinase family protein [Hyphomicrobium sp.]